MLRMPNGYDTWKLASPEVEIDEPRLDPCPFCGSVGAYYDGADGIECDKCGAAMRPGPDDETTAKRWNRRVQSAHFFR